ncbi:hypothetical protein TNCV_1809341 [Trichonephila clavipes]|nr:hypothetical protein TNCV_1809341 [Trichonephila clavipes]
MIFSRNHKLLEKAPTTKDAGLTPPAEGVSNISKYPGHLPEFACYDVNPHWRRRGLRKQDSSYGPRGKSLGRRGQASVPANLLDHPAQSIALDMQYPMHICAEMCRRSVMLESHTSLYVGWNTLQ